MNNIVDEVRHANLVEREIMSNIELKGLSEMPSSGLPPVHNWAPPFCGDMDMVIKSNGEWFHDGGKIKRPAMVTMFSRILWFENDEHFLVTPVEKVRIQVEDAPFLVANWQWIHTKHGIDCDLWMGTFKNEERPYISMRYGMKALVGRNVFYGMAESLERVETSKGRGMGIISAGKSYLLMQDE